MPFGMNKFGMRRPEDEEEDIWNHEIPGPFQEPDIRSFDPNPQMQIPETRSSVDEMLMPNLEPMPGSDQLLPEQIQPDPMIDPVQEVDQDPNMLETLMGSYGQEESIGTPVFDRYLEEIQNAPQRRDYQVGTGRKILAGLAGGLTGFTSGAERGAKVIQDITEGPYRQAKQDFKDRIEPLEKGVGFEKSFTETMRKQMNDQRGYGAKLAKIEGDYSKAKGQLDVAERNASTQEERTRIQQARLDLDRELKNARLDIDRMNAGANQTRAGAAQTSANARMNNSNTYVQNQGKSPKQVPIREQVSAEAVAYQDALDDVMSNPMIKNLFGNVGPVTVDRSKGAPQLVFPEVINADTQEMFKRMHKDAQGKRTKERLGKTY